MDDLGIKDFIEFEEQPCDSLEEADVVLVVGEYKIDDVLDELLVLADSDILVIVFFCEFVEMFEIEEVHFLMGELTLLVEVQIEVPQAVQGFH